LPRHIGDARRLQLQTTLGKTTSSIGSQIGLRNSWQIYTTPPFSELLIDKENVGCPYINDGKAAREMPLQLNSLHRQD
jgi:hypothetical protein